MVNFNLIHFIYQLFMLLNLVNFCILKDFNFGVRPLRLKMYGFSFPFVDMYTSSLQWQRGQRQTPLPLSPSMAEGSYRAHCSNNVSGNRCN